MARRLDGEAQDRIVEGLVGIVVEVAVGVALDDGKSPRHTSVDAIALQLHAAPVGVLGLGQELQQGTVAAADVENARARLHHLRNEEMIDAMGAVRRCGDFEHGGYTFSPRLTPAAFKKPRMVAKNSGSSKRKASWPLFDSISTKETLAATAFRACTISRLSRVG
jgi:hypothetical protein